MKTVSLAAGVVGGAILGMALTAGVLQAQPAPGEVPATPVAPRAATVQVPGSVQVTRLTDTSFVVVKDQGDGQVVTLFTTESGLVQKKHGGRFQY